MQAADDITWYGDSIKVRFDDFGEIALGNIESVGYPSQSIKLVKGAIQKTAVDNQNGDIALLRLDTDN